MTDPRKLSIHDFAYSLPEERIAKYPLKDRDASQLLIYKDGNITEDIYRNIAQHIPADSFMVFNNTKVVEARLLFQKETGGVIEIFCLEPGDEYPDISTAMLQQGSVQWKCLVGGASKWKPGQILEKKIDAGVAIIKLQARYVEKRNDHFIIALNWTPAQLSFAEVLHHTGAIPLPPYIKRTAEPSDTERYQTVYAQWDGSVAAPTAGLHFTENIFKTLSSKNINTAFVTLHVGAGTFKPVKADVMEDHEMHAEFIDVSRSTIEKILKKISLNHPIIAVGTTSLRTIESLYWLGVKSVPDRHHNSTPLSLSQWEAYDLAGYHIPPDVALKNLLHWMDEHSLDRVIAKTQIIIAPGYQLKIANALVTNFHQPQSTLLLLVAALVGDDWKKIYDHAMNNRFRFLSYGDGSLLWGKKEADNGKP
ncbi:MAG TPA: S-adenosylmethionine:tRNA ribosyltransferase-isomerase [Chitinophagaceae bacterium]|nr:S-adenosylmethionine:tRNA ribosyltransferase-isomerase [Chitinophagaceae bacterium]